MAVKDLPASTNFQVHYEDTIANAQTRAQVIANICEFEYYTTSRWFGITNAFGTSDRIHVYLDQPDNSGANNFGYQSGGKSAIHLDVQSSNKSAANAAEIVKMLFVAELVEVFMSYNNQHGANSWNAADSAGEALSQLCSIERYSQGHYLYYSSWVDSWLQNAGRPDWITTSEASDGNPVSFGCGLLFLYYLKTQRGYSVEQIVQKGGPNLEALYHNLTGSSGAFNAFNSLVGQYFPPSQTPTFGTYDNPFPLYGSPQRSAWVSIEEGADGPATFVASGVAHVKPFFFCGGGDYSFTINSTPQVITAGSNVFGFGQPVFAWRVNGVNVPPTGGWLNIQASVQQNDTSDPQQHTTSLQNMSVNCTAVTTGRRSAISIHVPAGVVGHVDLTIELLASERFVAPSTQTSATTTITAHNETVVWEDRYYRDREACHKRWNDLIHRFEEFNDIPIIFTLPDPPPDFERVIRYLAVVQRVLTVARAKAPEAARSIEMAITGMLNLTPALVEQIAKHASNERTG